jgi:hypothetical protein
MRGGGHVVEERFQPTPTVTTERASRVPTGLKLAYTAYMAVLVPVYWHYYGPTNFLYFCDVALILTLIAISREDALLVSMCCVGVVLPQLFWVADFLGHAAGYSLTGMTDYMFDASHSLFLRLLSLFHGWLPFLLIYLVCKIGYDRRALGSWTGLAWVLLLICFFLMPPPTPDAGLAPVNINYVWGMSDSAAQSWVPPYVWFAGLLIGLPLLVYAPTHFALSHIMPAVHLGPSTHQEAPDARQQPRPHQSRSRAGKIGGVSAIAVTQTNVLRGDQHSSAPPDHQGKPGGGFE